MKIFTRLSVAVFVLISILHMARVISGWDVMIDGREVPMGVSYFGIVFPALMAFMLRKENFK